MFFKNVIDNYYFCIYNTGVYKTTKGFNMPVFMKLHLIPIMHKVLKSNPDLQKSIGDLVFLHRSDLKNIDWSKAKVFVPCEPTAVPWIKIALSQLPKDVNFTTAFLGGNNERYKNNSLQTKLARLMTIFNGYKLKPFVNGIESEIISDMAKDVLHGPVELETKSSNTKANWENALKQGMLDGIETVIIVASNEGVVRHIGTLKAALKKQNIDVGKFNILAWPYTPTIKSDNMNLWQNFLGIKFPLPSDLVVCDKDNINTSVWGMYRTFMELFAIDRWSKQGDVYLTDEQKQLLKNIFDFKTLAFAFGKTAIAEIKETQNKVLKVIANKVNLK